LTGKRAFLLAYASYICRRANRWQIDRYFNAVVPLRLAEEGLLFRYHRGLDFAQNRPHFKYDSYFLFSNRHFVL
jgi:hypothetical protein